MSTFFITRHPGAREWARQEGIKVDFVFAHLDSRILRPGDVVIGTLPVHLAAQVCALGGRYLHLSLELPPEWRGRELSAADLRRCGARLEEYRVTTVNPT
jgi:CRISPR-associated protein Csx16